MWDRFRGPAGPPPGSSSSSNSWQPRSTVLAATPATHNSTAVAANNKFSIQKIGPPPPRPPREFEAPPPAVRQPLPPPPRSSTYAAPPRASNNRNENRDSGFRPVSSIYSQPSPIITHFDPHVRSSKRPAQEYEDISPPSSPEEQTPRDGHFQQSTPDISPIDEEDDSRSFNAAYNVTMSALDGLPSQRGASGQGQSQSPVTRTNIPMMRRERRQQTQPEGNRLRPSASRDQLRQPPPPTQNLRQLDSSVGLRQPIPIGQTVRPMVSREGLRETIGQRNLRPVASREGLRQPAPVDHGLRSVPSREGLRQPAPVDHGLRSVASRDRLRGQVNPRWDPMTGEMTTSAKGRPSQVKPVEYARGLGTTPSPPRKTVSPQPQPPKSPESSGDHMRQVPNRPGGLSIDNRTVTSDTDPAAGVFTDNRPGWRGASGRTAIVEPVKDTPEVAPLKIPPKSTKRPMSPPKSAGSGPVSGGGLGAIMASPPISPPLGSTGNGKQAPETSMKEQQIDGNAGKSPVSNPWSMANMANSLRSIIPSSQRQPSGHGPDSPHSGLPSPPLTSSPTPTGGVNASSMEAAANNAGLSMPLQSPSAQASLSPGAGNSPIPSPTMSQGPIRRKQVGAPSVHLNANSAAHHQQHESYTSSVYSLPDDPRNRRPLSSNPPSPATPSFTNNGNGNGVGQLLGAAGNNSAYVQPPSRFSVTTYATSAHTTTPRESFDDRPPLPTPPKEYGEYGNYTQRLDSPNPSVRLGDGMMDRQRPKLRNNRSFETDSEPVKISLSQPWMSESGANSAGIDAQNSPPHNRKEPKGPRDYTHSHPRDQDKDNHRLLQPKGPAARSQTLHASRPPSAVSTNKSLPTAPPEAQAESTKDRVAMLNAQISSLGNRRININRSIKQMTELMPTDNLMNTPDVIYKREMEKRKVEELKKELADVQREEHELGMKLHRAYKRLDQRAEYEPTSLWVRRATG